VGVGVAAGEDDGGTMYFFEIGLRLGRAALKPRKSNGFVEHEAPGFVAVHAEIRTYLRAGRTLG